MVHERRKSRQTDTFTWIEYLLYATGAELVFALLYEKIVGMTVRIEALQKTLMIRQSLLLFSVLFFGNLLFYVFIAQGKRNVFSLMLMVLFPAEIVILLGQKMYLSFLWQPFAIYVLVAFLIEFSLFKLKCNYRKTRGHKYIIHKWNAIKGMIKHTITRLGESFYCCLSAVFVCALFVAIIGGKKTYSTNVEVLNYIPTENLFEENRESLQKLNEEIFYNLSYQEKLDLLQVIANMESVFLGSSVVQLASDDMLEKGWAGYYDANNHMVVIDEQVVDGDFGVQEAVHVVLHEMFHVYQHDCINGVNFDNSDTDLLFYRQVANWREEFHTYKSFNIETDAYEDYLDYSNQSVERDAEGYAFRYDVDYMEFAK